MKFEGWVDKEHLINENENEIDILHNKLFRGSQLMQVLTCITLIVSVMFSHGSFCDPIVAKVDGGLSNGKQLQCRVYLFPPASIEKNAQGKIALLFSQGGTGVYTTYYNQPKDGGDYYLTMDKPGILPDLQSKDANNPIVDRTKFDFYTMNNLIDCAQNALSWADNYLNHANKVIILQGHSEGTVVMANLVKRILSDKRNNQFQDEIKALFLSGVVMRSMSDALHHQLDDTHDDKLNYKKLEQAYKAHNYDYIYNNLGVGWYWISSVFANKTPDVSIVLNDISKLDTGRALDIEIFQGINDLDIPAKWTMAFETKNKTRPAEEQLNVQARYYNAGHGLNQTAVSDIEMIKNSVFNKGIADARL